MGFWSDLRGGDSTPPSGTLDDAWRMLQAGAINDGRKLLLAICRSDPSNRPAHVLGAFELTRPPADYPNRQKLLAALDREPPPGFKQDFVVPFLAVLQFSPDGYRRAYETFVVWAWAAVNGSAPSDPHIAAMLLYSRVLMSDCLIQVSLPPASGKIDSALVNYAAQGAMQLMLRDARAIPTLQSGLDGKSTLSAYSEIAGRQFSAQEHAALSTRIAFECQIGLGLAHRDGGRKEQARAAFQSARAMAAKHQPTGRREIDPLIAEMLRPFVKESEASSVDLMEEAAIWRSPVPALEVLLREP
jgi:hypothetical protein